MDQSADVSLQPNKAASSLPLTPPATSLPIPKSNRRLGTRVSALVLAVSVVSILSQRSFLSSLSSSSSSTTRRSSGIVRTDENGPLAMDLRISDAEDDGRRGGGGRTPRTQNVDVEHPSGGAEEWRGSHSGGIAVVGRNHDEGNSSDFEREFGAGSGAEEGGSARPLPLDQLRRPYGGNETAAPAGKEEEVQTTTTTTTTTATKGRRDANGGGDASSDPRTGFQSQSTNDAQSPIHPSIVAGRRFPLHGTETFRDICGWAIMAANTKNTTAYPTNNCTLLVRPHNRSREGVAHWTSSIVTGHMQAMLVGCALRIDYGMGVNVSEALVPVGKDGNGASAGDEGYESSAAADAGYHWSVPPDVPCLAKSRCWLAPVKSSWIGAPPRPKGDDGGGGGKGDLGGKGEDNGDGDGEPSVFPGPIPAPVPEYRYSHGRPLSRGTYGSLLRSFPGMDLERGAACSLGTLFQLSPSAEDHVPGLFGKILPTLRGAADAAMSSSSYSSYSKRSSLVLALYVRTGSTDARATAQEKGKRAKRRKYVNGGTLGPIASNVVRCALQIEEGHRAAAYSSEALANVEGDGVKGIRGVKNGDNNDNEGAGYGSQKTPRIIWLIITDDPATGRAIAADYNSTAVANGGADRAVLVTSTRGAHSRPTRKPDTSDFVQAVVDWYLMGESDAVVTSGKGGSFVSYSFPFMGALRTARPLFDATDGTCVRREMSRG